MLTHKQKQEWAGNSSHSKLVSVVAKLFWRNFPVAASLSSIVLTKAVQERDSLHVQVQIAGVRASGSVYGNHELLLMSMRSLANDARRFCRKGRVRGAKDVKVTLSYRESIPTHSPHQTATACHQNGFLQYSPNPLNSSYLKHCSEGRQTPPAHTARKVRGKSRAQPGSILSLLCSR